MHLAVECDWDREEEHLAAAVLNLSGQLLAQIHAKNIWEVWKRPSPHGNTLKLFQGCYSTFPIDLGTQFPADVADF